MVIIFYLTQNAPLNMGYTHTSMTHQRFNITFLFLEFFVLIWRIWYILILSYFFKSWLNVYN